MKTKCFLLLFCEFFVGSYRKNTSTIQNETSCLAACYPAHPRTSTVPGKGWLFLSTLPKKPSTTKHQKHPHLACFPLNFVFSQSYKGRSLSNISAKGINKRPVATPVAEILLESYGVVKTQTQLAVSTSTPDCRVGSYWFRASKANDLCDTSAEGET